MKLDDALKARQEQIFSLDGLIAWLETQDPETEYDYADTTDCLLVRWARAGGHRPFEWAGTPDHTNLKLGMVAGGLPSTYGAALTRARHLRGY